jgi:hypothetical protein
MLAEAVPSCRGRRSGVADRSWWSSGWDPLWRRGKGWMSGVVPVHVLEVYWENGGGEYDETEQHSTIEGLLDRVVVVLSPTSNTNARGGRREHEKTQRDRVTSTHTCRLVGQVREKSWRPADCTVTKSLSQGSDSSIHPAPHRLKLRICLDWVSRVQGH